MNRYFPTQVSIHFCYNLINVCVFIKCCFQVVILCSVFVFRQIQRVRLNSARREVNSSVATEVSKVVHILFFISTVDYLNIDLEGSSADFRQNRCCCSLSDQSLSEVHRLQCYRRAYVFYFTQKRQISFILI